MSGCHKDSFDFDDFFVRQNPTATTPDDDGEMLPTPVVGISTTDNAMESEAVVLTITSDLAALAGGLTVTINIGVADAAEFDSADCTLSECVVIIAATEMAAELTITALSGDNAEAPETWTATIADGGANYAIDSAATDSTFDITNLPLPPVANTATLADLDAYDFPTPLAANEIRAGEDAANVGDITGFRYDDADGNLQVLVEKLDFAHLGIWITGDIADNNFQYANLADNAVTLATDFTGLGTVIYVGEGDFTYREIRLYPNTNVTLNFAAGTFTGSFAVLGINPDTDFGDANAMVPDGSGGMRPVANDDNLFADFVGTEITADGFNGDAEFSTATGFFADIPLNTFTDAVNGRFHHGDDYVMGTTTPTEISGTIDGIMDSNGMELKGGFLGQCFSNC